MPNQLKIFETNLNFPEIISKGNSFNLLIIKSTYIMKKYVISYISKHNFLILNAVVEASDRTEAIQEIKPDALLVLSCVTVG